MFQVQTLADAQACASSCLRYLIRKHGVSQGIDSVDITLVLSHLGLIGDLDETPGLRDKIKNRQWRRVAKQLQATFLQLESNYRAWHNTQATHLTQSEAEILFQTTATVLHSLVEYCHDLALAQRRQGGKTRTRRYRNRRCST